MRGSQFAQLVKDVRLVDGKNLTPLDVEFIFNKVMIMMMMSLKSAACVILRCCNHMQIHAYTHLTVGARSASVCLDCAAYNADCNLPCVRGLQARHPSERRLSYQHFLEAVQLLSQKKQVHMEVCDRCGITCKEKGVCRKGGFDFALYWY